jgi:hypothetical protein
VPLTGRVGALALSKHGSRAPPRRDIRRRTATDEPFRSVTIRSTTQNSAAGDSGDSAEPLVRLFDWSKFSLC